MSQDIFPLDRLSPLTGTLSRMDFEGEDLYSIEVPLAPFELNGETITTSIRLDLVAFHGIPQNNIDDKTFHYPVNPEDGYIDGSIYLDDAHNPVDVTKLRFHSRSENRITVDMEMTFVFEYEGIGYKNADHTLACVLEIS